MRMEANFVVEKQGFYTYKSRRLGRLCLNWQHGIERKIEDGQTVISELLEGITLFKTPIRKVNSNEKTFLKDCIVCF